MSWTSGKHAFKFGVDFIRDENNQNYLPNNLYGSFSFTGRYSGFRVRRLSARPAANNGTVQSGAKLVSSRQHVEFLRAGSVQGHAAPHFELWRALGIVAAVSRQVRTDFQLRSVCRRAGRAGQRTSVHQSALPEDREGSDGQPGRLSRRIRCSNIRRTISIPASDLAYKLTSNGKTVIRAGYGMYGNTIYGTIARNQWKAVHSAEASRFSIPSRTASALLSFPNPFVAGSGAGGAFQSASGFNPNLKVPYLQQWNVTLERQIGTVGVSVAYVGSHAVNLLYGRNINQPQPSTTPFSVSELPNPNFNTITWYENGASQKYNSLQVSAAKRMGKRVHFQRRLDLGQGSDGPV